MLFRYQCLHSKDVLGGGRGVGEPYFFLHILSSCAKIRLHTKNQLPGVSGSALKGVGGWLVAKGCRSEKYFPTNYLVNRNL